MGAVTTTTTVECRCPRCDADTTATMTREMDDAEQAVRLRITVQCPKGCQLTRAELATVARTLS